VIGKRAKDATLFDVGNVWALELKPDNFYSQLAVAARRLFRDDDFALLYCANNGRPSVPPSLLALTLILQTRAGVSDEEAIDRTAFDLRWAAVLGRHAGTPLCAKSTLQLFRHHLILHPEFRLLLQRSIEEAKTSGLITSEQIIAALDTKPMLGRGAVEDTYNLLGQAMRQLARTLVRETRADPQACRYSSIESYLKEHGLETLLQKLTAPSVKGSVSIDWSDESARDAFLTTLVKDARKLLTLANGGSANVRESAELLEKLILQDVEEAREEAGEDKNSGKSGKNSANHTDSSGDAPVIATLIQGTAAGRIPSATEPEQRHGRKSRSKRFTGHKSEIVVDTASGIVLNSDILPGDAPDDLDALKQIETAQENIASSIGATIVASLGDCAYGSGATRKQFADAGRVLWAKVPRDGGNKGMFPKSRFELTMAGSGETTAVACPAGHTSTWRQSDRDGGSTFYFGEHCGDCRMQPQCTTAVLGRSLRIHPQESILQQAREFQNSAAGRETLRKRLTVENALARVAAYGIAQARYKGHDKSRFQLSMACCTANLRRAWNHALGGNLIESTRYGTKTADVTPKYCVA
jgi:hypothetical protein